MSGTLLALGGFGILLALIAARAPIGLAMLLVGAAGYTQLSSLNAFLAYIKTNTYHQFANYTLSVIPLFILMGALAERAGIEMPITRAVNAVLAGKATPHAAVEMLLSRDPKSEG